MGAKQRPLITAADVRAEKRWVRTRNVKEPTWEMIEAGLAEFMNALHYPTDYDTKTDAVVAIYKAMMAVCDE